MPEDSGAMAQPLANQPIADNEKAVTAAVEQLYNTYPFPPDPLSDEAPPGYNWRWYWPAAHSFCTGRAPTQTDIRILDAGCGTGNGTDYLVHLNPGAEVVAVDLSPGAIAVATERLRRSGADADRVSFQNLSIYDLDQIPGEFDLINCVGVLHHMPDPVRGIRALANKLKPGGFLHIFVYGELGRWEVQLMQKAIALLQGDKRGDYKDGVAIGRSLFSSLPENNRLVQYEKQRWAGENQRDECFADMYVHPQEIDYNSESLFKLIDASDLDFLGFSNPDFWTLDRLVGENPDLMKRATGLSERQRYRLIELLDPNVTHYEFFLGKPPIQRSDWADETVLRQAKASCNPCLHGWPSKMVLNPDYRPIKLSGEEFAFMERCDQAEGQATVNQLLEGSDFPLGKVLSLWQQSLIFLAL